MLLKNSGQFPTTQRKYMRFALEYLIDFDMIRAYKSVYDDNGTMSDLVAQKAGSRLLRSVAVQNVIDRAECEYFKEKKLEKEEVVQKLQRVYICAMRDRDYTAANGALDKLMKHFGLYDKHNKQRRYSADELVGIKRKLEENGVNFDISNKPKSLSEVGVSEVLDVHVTEGINAPDTR